MKYRSLQRTGEAALPFAPAKRKFLFVALTIVITLGPAAVLTAQGQSLTVLYSFSGGTDGWSPAGGVVPDAAGNLYGTTFLGGDLTCNSGYGCGTVFKLDASGKKTILHNFTGGADGAYPGAGVLRDPLGNLYGTTEYAGDPTCDSGNGCGTVYKVDVHGRFSVLHAFTGPPDGSNPGLNPLFRDNQGNLYGATPAGGDQGCNSGTGCGTVFKLDSSGKESVLHAFQGADGEYPQGGNSGCYGPPFWYNRLWWGFRVRRDGL